LMLTYFATVVAELGSANFSVPLMFGAQIYGTSVVCQLPSKSAAPGLGVAIGVIVPGGIAEGIAVATGDGMSDGAADGVAVSVGAGCGRTSSA